jgi:plastocyanin
MTLFRRFALLLMALYLSLAQAAEFSVAQKNKAFAVSRLEIGVGDVVHFPNQDPFFHNVFSLSETKTFDLGSYPSGESKSVLFDKPGQVDVECAIHPEMHLVILVR